MPEPPLRRGRGDPTWQRDDDGIWLVGTTPDGPVTTLLRRRADGSVLARAWGPGAPWSLDGLPALLGADDRPGEFTAHHPLVADAVSYTHLTLPTICSV